MCQRLSRGGRWAAGASLGRIMLVGSAPALLKPTCIAYSLPVGPVSSDFSGLAPGTVRPGGAALGCPGGHNTEKWIF